MTEINNSWPLTFPFPVLGLQGSPTCPIPFVLFVVKEMKLRAMCMEGHTLYLQPPALLDSTVSLIGQTPSSSLIQWFLAEDTTWASFWPLSQFSEDSGAWSQSSRGSSKGVESTGLREFLLAFLQRQRSGRTCTHADTPHFYPTKPKSCKVEKVGLILHHS